MTIAKAGTLLCLNQGEYSDYNVIGFFVALADFDPANELQKFLGAHPEWAEDYSFESDAFVAELIRLGFLLDIPYSTMYLGAYSNASSFKFSMPNAKVD